MANDVEKRVTAKFVLDSTGFNSSLQGINQQLKVAQSEFKNANASVGAFGKSSSNLKSVQDALSKQFELQKQKVDIYNDSIVKTTTKMNENIKERDKLKSSLDGANAKYNEAVKLYGKESTEAAKAKAEVDKLTQEYDKKQKAVESNAKSIQNYTANMNKAEAEMKKTQGELQKVSSELTTNTSKWIKAEESIKKVGANITAAGDKMVAVGSGIAKSGAVITATFAAVGASALKAYEEVKTGTDQIARLTGATGTKFSELKQVYEDTARESAASFEDIGIAVGNVSVRLNLTGNALKQASLDFMKFAKINNTDVSTSIQLVSRAMGDAGIKTTDYKEVLDLLTTASQNSGIQVSVLTENLAKYGAPMRALGFDTKETIALFSGWEKAGVNVEIAMAGMKKAISNWGKAGKDSGAEFKKVLKDIQDTPTLAAATTKAIAIFGQKAGPDLADAIKGGRFAYEDFMKILETSDGKLDATAKNMAGNTAEMKKAWHSVTLASAELGETISKELAPIMKDVASKIKDFTKYWDSLSDSTKQSIAKFGLATIAVGGIATALGGATIAIGGFVKGIGGIVGLGGNLVGTVGNLASKFGLVAAAAEGAAGATAGAGAAAGVAAGEVGALGAATAGASVAIAPFLVGAAAVAGTGFLIYKAMTEEAVPAVDLFKDKWETTAKTVTDANGNIAQSTDVTVTKISEGTKKAVGAYMKLDDDAKQSLTNLYVNSTVITGQLATDTVGKYNEMATQIKASIDKRNTDEITTMANFYAESKALTDKEEAAILAAMQTNNTNQKEEEDKYVAQIKAILDKASAEKRALTLEEQQQINSIQETMRTNAVKTMSDSEVEQKVILERLKGYGERITAEQASAEIKNANDARDKTVKAAEEKYNKTVASIIRQRDESHTITADQAQKLIADAETQKTETVKKAEEMRGQAVSKITSMNRDITSNVDTSTGKILTSWDKLKAWWNSWWPQPKTVTVNTNGIDLNSSNVKYTTSFGYTGRAIGDSDFQGGYTTLHERGYELYNLPQGTRIWNHEASQDLVMKTAEQVAKGVLDKMTNINAGGVSTIIVPVNLDGREITRVVAENQDIIDKYNSRNLGGVF